MSYLDESAQASRERMTDADWKGEVEMNSVEDAIDPTSFLEDVLGIYKFHRDDPAYFGAQVARIIDNEVTRIANKNREDFKNGC